ncbi:transcriptional regulator [Saccharothrix sp. Mg75]|uniref:transcriptional regulator n=1 Tax=Saccharothrix sp. Mg75 TaxID=3445357 RepID=UPI003EEEA056
MRLRAEVFRKAVTLAGYRSDYELARAMGVNRSTISRVRSGTLTPGQGFIAGALVVLAPMGFDDLFTVDSQ